MVSLRAVVVAGPMKTGTSAVALAMTKMQRIGALPKGVFFPVDEYWPFQQERTTTVKHHELRFFTGGKVPQESSELVLSTIEGLARKIRNDNPSNQNVAVFVWEGLTSRVRSRESRLTAFHSTMENLFDQVTYVVSMRRQDEALRSIFSHLVRDERTNIAFSFEKFLESGQRQHEYDYWSIVKTFEDANLTPFLTPIVFSEDDIGTPRHLQKISIASGFGPIDVSLAGLDKRLIHPSLSKSALRVISLARSVSSISRGDKPSSFAHKFWLSLRDFELKRIDKLVGKSRRTGLAARFGLSPEVSREIMDLYMESNKRIVARYPDLCLNSWLSQVTTSQFQG